MKKFFAAGVVIIAAILVFCLFKPTHPLTPSGRGGTEQATNETLPISATITTPTNKKIQVRIVDTQKTRELGLSYFKTLPADQGMLFLFDQPGNYAFWMKDMNFPLDIIWLRRASPDSFEVVYVAENVDPSSYPNMIDPAVQADAVLEINVGKSRDFGTAEGEMIKLDIYNK